jgi:hypothetical protein
MAVLNLSKKKVLTHLTTFAKERTEKRARKMG